MKKTYLFLTLILFSLASAFGQRYTISGVVKDSANGETLKDIWVMLIPIEDATQSFTGTSNLAGFYSITAPKGTYILNVNYLGYRTITDTISLLQNMKLNFELVSNVVETEGVTITGKAADHNVSSTDVGKMEMKIETIKSLPALFGEVDVLKSVQLLPGV